MAKRDSEIKRDIAKFVKEWTKEPSYSEDQSAREYWRDLTEALFDPSERPKPAPEKRVKIGGFTKRIDLYYPETKILVENKSSWVNLADTERQEDGKTLTPYGQAKRYNDNLPYDEKARYIITCNIKSLRVYDMNTSEPEKNVVEIALEELETKYNYLVTLFTDPEAANLKKDETEVSVQAGEIVGKLYSALYNSYDEEERDTAEVQNALNKLCVRLVFCLYAEDSGLFDAKDMFTDFVREVPAKYLSSMLSRLFYVLSTPEGQRQGVDDDLECFPYVNGGLFTDDGLKMPKRISDETKKILTDEAGAKFDWSKIDPTIFGAVFESTLNPDTRRSGGMHYTSIENIRKVIDPLFLDDLKAELEEIEKTAKNVVKYQTFQSKLASLRFLDPACGSGNFLTETYLELRRLENKALAHIMKFQITMADETIDPIKVKIDQFYGIEINDFAVSVAKTALWIAESQTLRETERIVNKKIDFLPLRTQANITEGNA
ncbi:MAG: methylase, partial [Abditibacteriota bacterium]|nr:methylase [Abditibacteriota bacterium]